jgi:hypothetical protein
LCALVCDLCAKTRSEADYGELRRSHAVNESA